MRQYVQHIIHWTSIIFIQTYTFYSLIPPYYNTLFCCCSCSCSCCWCLNILFFKLNLWFCYFAYFSCRSQTLRLLVRCKNVRRLQTTYFFLFFLSLLCISYQTNCIIFRHKIRNHWSDIFDLGTAMIWDDTALICFHVADFMFATSAKSSRK